MANKMLLISILFHFLENGIDFMSNELKLFLQSNKNEIFNLIFNHLSEIINDFKCPKLNLAVFDQSLISDHICKLTKADDLFSTLYFIEKFCFNTPKIEFSQEVINLLLQILHEKLKEQKYNDTLFIIKYIKKEMLNEFNDVSMPDFIKNEMYNIKINEDIGIDELLNNALIKSNLGEIDEILKFLFKKMMKDKEIYENYICYKTIKQNESSFDDIKYLSSFYKEYQENPDLFIDIINKMFYYYKYSKKLLLKWKFRLSSLPAPKYGIPIVSMLFKSNTFQSFVCLQRIASSFPFIFIENSQQIFDSVHPHFDHLSLIFETNLNDESLLKIKTAYSALSFLSSTLQSVFILDDFLNWLFSNILTFSNSQAICYIICFYGVYCASTKIEVNALIQKYNFLKTLENLLERDVKGEQFSNFYKNYIYSLAEMIYLSLFECNQKCILLIENYQNFEKPLYYVEDTLYRKSFKDPIIDSKYFEFFSKDVVRFMMNFNSNSDFWENIKDKCNSPNRSKADDIISKLIIIDKDLSNTYTFPYYSFDYSVKIYKYFFLQSRIIYFIYLKEVGLELTSEDYEIFANLNKIFHDPEYEIGNKDENLSINMYDTTKYLIPTFKCLINIANIPFFIDILNIIGENKKYLKVFLDLITEKLINISNETIKNNDSIIRIIDIINFLLIHKNVEDELFEKCMNNLINVILLPELRFNSILQTKVSLILDRLIQIPNRSLHIIAFQLYQAKKKKQKDLIPGCYFAFIEKFVKNEVYKEITTKFCQVFDEHGNKQAKRIYDLLISGKISSFDTTFEYYIKNNLFPYDNIIVSKYPLLALSCYQKCAEMGNVESLYFYAKTCEFIIKNNYKYKTEFDINNYLNYLKKAALNGHKESIKEYVQLILKNKVHLEREELKKWLEEGIKLGIHKAMFKYGLTIKDEDERKGLFYLREAASKGYVDAISLLHYINLEKKGIKERSYEYYKKDADKYKQILLNYRSNNYYQFVDDKFPPESNWKRIDEVYKAPLFQKNLIDPGFIKQGYVSDCYFISALCFIANNADLVHELFEYKLPNEILGVVDNSINIKCGAVVIYFYAFGRITPVLIDTYIPLQENGDHIISYLSNKRKSPWFILVEKAFAKLSGSFTNICGGCFSIPSYNLCFYYPKKIEITFFDIYRNSFPKYYEKFTKYINNGYFIGCSIVYSDAEQGLVEQHLYSIFQTKKINDVKLFLLRNPWGYQEWNGDFSRSSVFWNFKLKKELNYNNLPEGYFWIPEKDFKKYFQDFIIAKPISSDCKIKMFHCKINPSNHSGAYFENDEDETFGIRIVKPIQKDEKCKIHFIVEYQSSSFTKFYKDLNNYFSPSKDDKRFKSQYDFIIADTKGKNLRYNSEKIESFKGLTKVESFCYDACNNNVLSVWIRRLLKCDYVLNFYVTVFCKNEFELFNLKNPEIKFPDIQNNHIYK